MTQTLNFQPDHQELVNSINEAGLEFKPVAGTVEAAEIEGKDGSSLSVIKSADDSNLKLVGETTTPDEEGNSYSVSVSTVAPNSKPTEPETIGHAEIVRHDDEGNVLGSELVEADEDSERVLKIGSLVAKQVTNSTDTSPIPRAEATQPQAADVEPPSLNAGGIHQYLDK